MRKYLQKVFDRLSGLKNGINLNATDWTGQPDTPATVQAEMDALITMDNDIQQLEDALQQKISEARGLAAAKNEVAGIIEKRAIGIHAGTPLKLVEYNIKPGPTPGQPRPVPGKAIISSIADDDDGIGFKLRIQKLDGVEHYEVERGLLTRANIRQLDDLNPTPEATTVLQPPYPFLRTTRKLSFVDDDVEPGIRHFYRVRGVNASGAGQWSEPVSAVQ